MNNSPHLVLKQSLDTMVHFYEKTVFYNVFQTSSAREAWHMSSAVATAESSGNHTDRTEREATCFATCPALQSGMP